MFYNIVLEQEEKTDSFETIGDNS